MAGIQMLAVSLFLEDPNRCVDSASFPDIVNDVVLLLGSLL